MVGSHVVIQVLRWSNERERERVGRSILLRRWRGRHLEAVMIEQNSQWSERPTLQISRKCLLQVEEPASERTMRSKEASCVWRTARRPAWLEQREGLTGSKWGWKWTEVRTGRFADHGEEGFVLNVHRSHSGFEYGSEVVWFIFKMISAILC